MPSQNLLETQQETSQASDVLQDCQTEPEKQLSVQTGAKPTLFKKRIPQYKAFTVYNTD